MNFRAPKLRESFRHAPRCFGCGIANDGTVVGAHANWSEYGKGMSIKAHDWAIAGLCRACHAEIDQGGKLTREERKEKWHRAWLETLDWWFREGVVRA